MAVLSIELSTRGEQARATRDTLEQTDHYRAVCTSWDDIWPDLLRFAPELAPGEPHGDVPGLYVDSFESTRMDEAFHFDIAVLFKSIAITTSNDVNPLARPAEWSTSSADRRRIRYRDNKGRAVMNLCGELIDDPPPEDEVADLIHTFKKNLPIRLPAWLSTYGNAVNSDVVRIRGLVYQPGKLKLKNLTIGKDDEENDTPFCELSGQLHYREEGWTTIIPHRGRYQLVKKKRFNLDKQRFEEKFEREPILIKGERPLDPEFLDADGKWLGPGTPPVEKIHYLEFDFSNLKPFNSLPLK